MLNVDRRTFLKVLGAGMGAVSAFGAAPLLRAFAAPNATAKDCFIFIHQAGGWDVSLWSDPRNRRVDKIEPATLETMDTAGLTGWVDDPLNDGSGDVSFKVLEKGSLRLGPAMGSLADKFGRLTIVNGLATNTVSHPDGTYFSSTGRHLAGGRPVGTSIDTMMANELGQQDVLPLISVGFPSTFLDPQLSRAVMPLQVNDVTAVAKSVTRSNLSMSEVDRDRVNVLLANEAAELADGAYFPDSLQGMSTQFGALGKLVDSKTRTLFDPVALKAAHPQFNYAARFQRGPALSAAFAVEAIKRGFARCVSLQMSGCDTHSANYQNHGMILQETFELVSTLVDDLDKTTFDQGGELLADHVHILVVSEFCRSPDINITLGRDHHPNNSALVVSKKFKGQTVFGSSDEGQLLPVDVESPSFVEKRAPTPADVLATFLGAFGVDPRKYLRDGEIIKEILA